MDELLLRLQYALARLYLFREDQLVMVRNVGIRPELIVFDPRPVTFWALVLAIASEAQKNKLIDIALEEFPDTPELLAYKNRTKIVELPAVEVRSVVSEDKKVLEKLTGAQSTLLPISFLEKGLKMSESICLVNIGYTGALGTGFLIDNDILITNNHVFENAAVAKDSKLWFNYQDDANGAERQVAVFELDPDAYFKTSIENDFTVVKVKSNAKGTANSQFGALKMASTPVRNGEFVNIIQHPAGQKKQIGLYHNAITMANEQVVQYLTDTLPGSSGSPVFNSNWEVVALHHAGTYVQDPEPNGPKAYNEGINIARVAEAL